MKKNKKNYILDTSLQRNKQRQSWHDYHDTCHDQDLHCQWEGSGAEHTHHSKVLTFVKLMMALVNKMRENCDQVNTYHSIAKALGPKVLQYMWCYIVLQLLCHKWHCLVKCLPYNKLLNLYRTTVTVTSYILRWVNCLKSWFLEEQI